MYSRPFSLPLLVRVGYARLCITELKIIAYLDTRGGYRIFFYLGGRGDATKKMGVSMLTFIGLINLSMVVNSTN